MRMMLSRLIVTVACLTSLPIRAHEFWIDPVTATVTPGGSANVSLLVGEQFEGDLVGFSVAQTAAFRHFSVSGAADLSALLPAAPVAAVAVPLKSAGTHLLVFDSQPNFITLPADSFHAYLHDEGLDTVKVAREAAGTSSEPGRERYRRFVKTLVPAGRVSAGNRDAVFATVAGQRLEIVPLTNPLAMRTGDDLGLKVLFEGKPLSDALVKAWHKRSGQTLAIRAKTAVDGSTRFSLPYAGSWMISVVHMVPATGEPGIDWDSFWGNLTFVLPQRR